MTRRTTDLATTLLMLAAPVHAAQPTDDPQATALYQADQADRQAPTDLDRLQRDDAARRASALRLLNAGAIRSGADYFHLAYVFQHGEAATDILRAHGLAMAALALGHAAAGPIAAATLDRYLMQIGQPQIYGTQSVSIAGGAWTQEPFDRTVIDDAQRKALGIRTLAEQARRLEELRAMPLPASPRCRLMAS